MFLDRPAARVGPEYLDRDWPETTQGLILDSQVFQRFFCSYSVLLYQAYPRDPICKLTNHLLHYILQAEARWKM